MATAYTPILKLALPVTGELNGTWGTVVNDNITSMVEQAVAGLATINTWTANSHTLTTANGTTSESRCAMLVIDDDGAGNPSAAATVICPNATKPYIVQNICGQTVTVKTSAGTGVAIPNNQAALVFCNGTNVVTGAFNGDVVGPASATDNAIVRYDGATGKLIQNSSVTIDDSNNISGVVQLNATTLDATNLEVTNLKAKDGTAAGSIADSTGIVTLASTVLTTTDINGGTVDNATIGATTASTVRATQVDIIAQGDLRLQDTTGGEFVALQAPGTLASSYTLTLPVDDGTSGQALITDGSGVLSWSTAASGDVYGPASATDNAIARFDGTTGKIIQNSAITIADDGATVIAANSTSDGLRITQIGTGNALVVEDSANPDASPFVIDQSGIIGIGTTTPQSTFSIVSGIGIQSSSAFAPQVVQRNKTNDTSAPYFISQKDRAGAIVQSGDAIGNLVFQAYDGASYINSAIISAAVDGTPGTNDMPGRLTFNTTADGASSPTERMRIDSAGRVGIGASTVAGIFVNIGHNLTGATSVVSVRAIPTILSDVTSSVALFRTQPFTQAAAFTLGQLIHYDATLGSIGAGSAIANQYGFNAAASLIGATNNFGFYSAIPSGTGRWNFYAAGTAANYFAGATTFNSGVTINGAITATDPVVQQSDIGTAPNEIPLNQYLGNLAYQDAANIASNVGVGVATSAWGSTFKVMQVSAGSLFSTTSNNASFGSNVYVDSASATRYIATTTATRYLQLNGTHRFFNAPSGTAGDVATFTETVRIDASGNVGIGTTAPNASAILDVQSTTKGVRMPNMTTTQKNAIASPAAGLMVFDTTLSKLSVYTGASWETITSV